MRSVNLCDLQIALRNLAINICAQIDWSLLCCLWITGSCKSSVETTCTICWLHCAIYRSSVGHRSHTRISYDSLRCACNRLSQGIFNLARMNKCATRR